MFAFFLQNHVPVISSHCSSFSVKTLVQCVDFCGRFLCVSVSLNILHTPLFSCILGILGGTLYSEAGMYVSGWMQVFCLLREGLKCVYRGWNEKGINNTWHDAVDVCW